MYRHHCRDVWHITHTTAYSYTKIIIQDRATPLMKAARGGYAKIVDLLLAHKGIAVNVQDKVIYFT